MEEKKQKLFRYLVENSFETPPSVRELCSALRIKSTSTVHLLLHELQDEGLIVIAPGKRRNVSIMKSGRAVTVPILGTVTAGTPIVAYEDVEDFITFDSPRSHGGNLFALRVRGDSMINAGIFDEDIIVVRRAQTAEDGTIVVALVGDEATVKRLYRRDGCLELHAENPDYPPITDEDISLLGIVVACIRHY